MGFVVLHMEKAHGSDSGTTAHIERFIIPKNADPTRTHLNRRLIEYPDGVKDRSAAIQQRLEEAGLTRKIGSNQVRAIRINVSGTHEDMKRIEEEGRLDEWCADNLKYFADTFGKENIVAAHLHRDEETPHIHVTLVPIVKEERKRRKREEQTATLLTGNSIEYSGELYSKEYERKFMAENVKSKVFSDNGRFILTVDLCPIREWFKEQFEKLRQTICQPIIPQRKGRGFKL